MMSRRQLLINAVRTIVHNGITLPDAPTAAVGCAVIWDSVNQKYYYIPRPPVNYNWQMSYSDGIGFSLYYGSYNGVTYYESVAPYTAWSSAISKSYNKSQQFYGSFRFDFPCAALEHILYASLPIYDTTANSWTNNLRDADSLSYSERNGAFSDFTVGETE